MSETKPTRRPATALTIAGSDSGGGAGIQADLKTFAALRVHGLSAVSALTAQSTVEVRAVFSVPASFVALQLDTLMDDFHIDAVKTGMLSDPETIEVVQQRAQKGRWRVVVDPVMVASSGARLVSAEVVDGLRALIASAEVVTPNLDEVEVLVGHRPQDPEEMTRAGQELLRLGCRAVLVKGGHLRGDPVDVWVERGGRVLHRSVTRIPGNVGHGTGCTYAAALTALLARGRRPDEAFRQAHAFVNGALRAAPENLGGGSQPLHPLFEYFPGLAEAGSARAVDAELGRS
ncbi:MAG: bifunctional hydroxymethylpyrimidine kinase/phosphomethylpyrimidine kinase [Myxococcota bacterium]